MRSMADVGSLTKKYNQVVGQHQWLKFHKESVEDAYIDEDVKRRVWTANDKDVVGYKDCQWLKSGRDVVSGYTWYDIRKRVSPQTVELVTQLFSLDKHRLLMLRWVCRGASVYVSFCKVIETDPYVTINAK